MVTCWDLFNLNPLVMVPRLASHLQVTNRGGNHHQLPLRESDPEIMDTIYPLKGSINEVSVGGSWRYLLHVLIIMIRTQLRKQKWAGHPRQIYRM